MIAELFIDERSGAVVQLDYKNLRNNMQLQSITSQDIISLGQDVLIIRRKGSYAVKAIRGQLLPILHPPQRKKRLRCFSGKNSASF